MNADLTRRALLAALACAIAVPGAALAQDPRASEVQGVARDWLTLADKVDIPGTWKAAGERFRASISEERWATLLQREREARGAVTQRTAAGTSFPSQLAPLPAGGTYATIHFRTAFANEPHGFEDVTLERDPDSTWRVIGYAIR